MNDRALRSHELTPEVRRAIIKWIIQAVIGTAGDGLVLFLAAGTLFRPDRRRVWAVGWEAARLS